MDIGTEQSDTYVSGTLEELGPYVRTEVRNFIRRILQEELVSLNSQLEKPAQEYSLKARLSAREMDVLKLLLNGCTNHEIANELCLGSETVKTHVRHIMDKFNVNDRARIIAKAWKYGLVQYNRSDSVDLTIDQC